MDEFGQVPERFTFYLGGFLPNVTTKASLSTKSANGTPIDFNNQLGLTPNTQTVDALFSWRISKRNYVAFQYFGFGRRSTKTLSDSVVWGGDVYHAGATVDVDNHITYYGFSGPGLGIDALNLNSSIALRVAASGGGGGFADSAKKTGSVTAPVPMIGIFGDWEFVPRVLVKGGFQYLYINNIQGIGGHVSDDAIGVDWYPLRNFGIGGLYHYVGTEISHTNTKSGNKTSFNYVIQGPALYVIATF
jgi:hypothetical protein